jgi:hypothetical protein
MRGFFRSRVFSRHNQRFNQRSWIEDDDEDADDRGDTGWKPMLHRSPFPTGTVVLEFLSS